MNNELLLWLLFIVPWISLPFIKKEDLKKFMPSAFFTVFACVVIYYVGIFASFWYQKEVATPLMICGLFPVTTLWILKFTYGQFWRYIITNAVTDVVFAFIIFPWFGHRGILGIYPLTYVYIYVACVIVAVLIYQYQKWQDSPPLWNLKK